MNIHPTVLLPPIVALIAFAELVRLAHWLNAKRAAAGSVSLPDAVAQAAEMVPCPECKSTCELCEGSGEVRCEMMRCGGQGFQTIASIPCRASGCKAETGKVAPGCTLCLETGVEITQRAECPSCHGHKKVKCMACGGSGVASTGRVGGAYQAHGGMAEPPMCRKCGGLAKVAQFVSPTSTGTRVSV